MEVEKRSIKIARVAGVLTALAGLGYLFCRVPSYSDGVDASVQVAEVAFVILFGGGLFGVTLAALVPSASAAAFAVAGLVMVPGFLPPPPHAGLDYLTGLGTLVLPPTVGLVASLMTRYG